MQFITPDRDYNYFIIQLSKEPRRSLHLPTDWFPFPAMRKQVSQPVTQFAFGAAIIAYVSFYFCP